MRLDAVVREAEAPTSAAIVLVAGTGERSFFYRTGGNERLANRHVADAVLKAAEIVHVGGAMKLLNLDLAELMGRAKSFGCITSLDTDWDINGQWMKKLENALPRIDYLMTNEEEAAMLTGKERSPRGGRGLAGARAEGRGASSAASAARCWPRTTASRSFPPAACEVLDTTCAGDAFAAGFLLGISRGRPLEQSLRLAQRRRRAVYHADQPPRDHFAGTDVADLMNLE